MATALVVHKDRLPQSQKMHRAAQYVRMSTDYQQYSIENQAVVIATYAELHKLTIVRTYRDEGESGLKIENRAGLQGSSSSPFPMAGALQGAPHLLLVGSGCHQWHRCHPPSLSFLYSTHIHIS
jgi:hypothetical protein